MLNWFKLLFIGFFLLVDLPGFCQESSVPNRSLTLLASKDKVATMVLLRFNRPQENDELVMALKTHPEQFYLGDYLKVLSLASPDLDATHTESSQDFYLYALWIKDFSSIGKAVVPIVLRQVSPRQDQQIKEFPVMLYFSAPVLVKAESVAPQMSFLAMDWTPTFWEEYRQQITSAIFLLVLLLVFALFIWPVPQWWRRGRTHRLYLAQRKYWEKKLFLATERQHFDELWNCKHQWFFLVSPTLQQLFSDFAHRYLYLPAWDVTLQDEIQQLHREKLVEKNFWLPEIQVPREQLIFYNRWHRQQQQRQQIRQQREQLQSKLSGGL